MTTQQQLDSFYQFATAQLQISQREAISFVDLIDRWQSQLEDQNLVATLNERWLSAQAGDTLDLDEFLSQFPTERTEAR